MQLYHGDCLEVMAQMEPNSVDSIVTDPPYGLAFMGKDWDHGVPGIPFWEQALRVAKPGAHLLAFGGTRTFHRLAVAIEDAGWELRDTVMWVYGSGFPKSHDVSKAIDKAAGAEREVVGTYQYADRRREGSGPDNGDNCYGQYGLAPNGIIAPATPAALQWAGWGTALKPAWEPIIVARKPLAGTVAANVLAWGTGAINVDGCRVGAPDGVPLFNPSSTVRWGNNGTPAGLSNQRSGETSTQGRWPANVTHDGSDEVLAGFPVTTSGNGSKPTKPNNPIRMQDSEYVNHIGHGDTGSAARFFYCAKASKADRDEGLEGMPEQKRYTKVGDTRPCNNGDNPTSIHSTVASVRNHHPTVKPTALMRWLVRLVTPPGGVVLDPFMGSGSTGKAAVLEGASFIGIEQDGEYLEIARRRIDAAKLPLLEAVLP